MYFLEWCKEQDTELTNQECEDEIEIAYLFKDHGDEQDEKC